MIDGGTAGTTGGATPPYAALLAKGQSTQTGAPKAYLNFLVFDRDYHVLDGGFIGVTTAAREYGQDCAHEQLSKQLIIKKAGYVYLYLSNDNAALGGNAIEVFFDDFTVQHIKSPVVQQDDYYAFGLTFNSLQRENSTANKWKFQGQEHVTDLDLGWDSFKWRNHMPDIGRFFNVDPLSEKYYYNSVYAFSENKVVAHIELEGLESVTCHIRQYNNSPYGNEQFSPSDRSVGARLSVKYNVADGTLVYMKNNRVENLKYSAIVDKEGTVTFSGSYTAQGARYLDDQAPTANFSIQFKADIDEKGNGTVQVNAQVEIDKGETHLQESFVTDDFDLATMTGAQPREDHDRRPFFERLTDPKPEKNGILNSKAKLKVHVYSDKSLNITSADLGEGDKRREEINEEFKGRPTKRSQKE